MSHFWCKYDAGHFGTIGLSSAAAEAGSFQHTLIPRDRDLRLEAILEDHAMEKLEAERTLSSIHST